MTGAHLYVLVGGWPGSGKTTLARALAPALGLAYLGKDELKESLMAECDTPADVPASRRLGGWPYASCCGWPGTARVR